MQFRYKLPEAGSTKDYNSIIKELKELAPGICNFQYEDNANTLEFDAPSTFYRALLYYGCTKLDRLHK